MQNKFSFVIFCHYNGNKYGNLKNFLTTKIPKLFKSKMVFYTRNNYYKILAR